MKAPTPQSLRSHDGLLLAAEEWGHGSDVVFAHANGFHKESWRPVGERLPRVRGLAVDLRGHGDSAVGPEPFDWWDLGRDLVGWAGTRGRPRVGVGHSSGGAAMAMAEILEPGTWDALVLIEPIVFPGPYERKDDHPLVQGALRRRASFADRADTRAAYAGRGPFSLWTDAALDLYVEFGFRDGPDGRRHLACAPATEAAHFREGHHHTTWERLDEVRCPVTVVVGERSDTHPPAVAVRLAERLGAATLVTVPGASHFVPMERPAAVADLVATAVADAGG